MFNRKLKSHNSEGETYVKKLYLFGLTTLAHINLDPGLDRDLQFVRIGSGVWFGDPCSGPCKSNIGEVV